MAQNDAWRAYVELALGLTDTSRKKAMKIVQQVAGKGGATAEQLQELVNQGMANREAMTRMIRVELDRALGRVGLATMDEVDELSKRVRDLEKELRAARATSPAPGNVVQPLTAAAEAPVGPPPRRTAKKTVAKKTVARKAATPATRTEGAVESAAPVRTRRAPAKKTATTAAGAAKATTGAKTTTTAGAAKKTTPRATRSTTARSTAAKRTSAYSSRRNGTLTTSTGSGASGVSTGTTS